jgi:hypothetical protein
MINHDPSLKVGEFDGGLIRFDPDHAPTREQFFEAFGGAGMVVLEVTADEKRLLVVRVLEFSLMAKPAQPAPPSSNELDLTAMLVNEAKSCAKHLNEEGMGYSADVVTRTANEIERLQTEVLQRTGTKSEAVERLLRGEFVSREDLRATVPPKEKWLEGRLLQLDGKLFVLQEVDPTTAPPNDPKG